jgi:NAD+ kinase
MNKYNNQNLEKIVSKTKLISISPLEMKVLTISGKTFSAIAVNEISLLRQSRQTASLQIMNKNKILIKKLVCDGVLVSTPAGSTAYNLSVSGPILSLNSKKLAVTAISPFRPRRWKGRIVSSSSIIKIKNLNIQKRSVSAVADNFEVRNIRSIIIKNNSKIKFKLLYDKDNSLTKKIQLEKYKKKNKKISLSLN